MGAEPSAALRNAPPAGGVQISASSERGMPTRGRSWRQILAILQVKESTVDHLNHSFGNIVIGVNTSMRNHRTTSTVNRID